MGSDRRGLRVDGYRIRPSDNMVNAVKQLPRLGIGATALALVFGGVPFAFGLVLGESGTFTADPIVDLPVPAFTVPWLQGVLGIMFLFVGAYIGKVGILAAVEAVSWCVEIEVVEDDD